MKLKIKKMENGEWFSGIYAGNGGISSLINSIQSRSLFKTLRVFFKFGNWKTAILGK